MPGYRYKAFISYRHVPRDRKWARWLIEKLETYRAPRAIVRQGFPARIGHLYRDDDEVPASTNLSHQIEQALQASEYLIVVCSPDTPASRWVRQEIKYFRSIGRSDHILALLVEGEPAQSFPPELLHILRERVGADGETIVETVDEEPIAADVRARPDERASAIEHRALLRIAAGLMGVSFDDLAQRDRQRRRRRQRLWATIAAMLLVAVIAGGYAYWDYNTVHTRYYAEFSTRWGVPFGIGPLGADVAAHRAESYAIDSLQGRVTAVRQVNGSGTLVETSADSEGASGGIWYLGVAEWQVGYEGDRVASINLLNGKSHLIVTWNFQFLPDKRGAVVSFRQATGASITLNNAKSSFEANFRAPADGDHNVSSSLIAQNELRFTQDGLIERRLFQTVWGEPARDAAGSYGQIYRYSPEGLVTSTIDIDQAGEPLSMKTGIAETRFAYDGNASGLSIAWLDRSGHLILRARETLDAYGNPLEISAFDADGAPTVANEGCATTRKQYDSHGNMIRAECLGSDGQHVYASTSAPIVIVRNDGNGRQVGWNNLDGDGKPVTGTDGCFAGANKFDSAGNLVEQTCLSATGSPMTGRDGVAFIEAIFDDRGIALRNDYFGPDRKPVLNNKGCASDVTRNDIKNRVMSVKCLDTNGAPSIDKSTGAAIRTQKADIRGNIVEQVFLGVDAKPIIANDGCARIAEDYDERGDLTSKSCFNAQDRLAPGADGTASVLIHYDEKGNAIEYDMLGPDQKPIANRDGCAYVLYGYDGSGNQTDTTCLNAGRQPTMSGAGFYREITSYDSRAHVVRTDDYGTDGTIAWSERDVRDVRGNALKTVKLDAGGRPVLDKDGCYGKAFEYDGRSLTTASTCLAPDGRPMRGAAGFAHVRMHYDQAGNRVEESYFDEIDRPMSNREMGVARVSHSYNDRSEEVETDYFGPDGKPAPFKDTGLAVMLANYDARGNLVEEHYLGVNRTPTLRTDMDVAGATYKFNERGWMVESRTLDLDGRPRADKTTGVSGIVNKYDERGNAIEQDFLDLNGAPVRRTDWGCAATKSRYDGRGKKLEEAYFDIDGRSMNNAYGYARRVFVQDPFGAVIRTDFYDVTGRLLGSK
ncbi:MAG TPA: toll/interleukin-1 receptor domain-containing protein [Rhizomicrobium sp.]|jgi:hypothetical protein|nr:toll/interleukin-1 receptor domain-containing protein [Rhizomicrobium sp.]